MRVEDFVVRYIAPAAKQLADKVKRGEPLSDEEKDILLGCLELHYGVVID